MFDQLLKGWHDFEETTEEIIKIKAEFVAIASNQSEQ